MIILAIDTAANMCAACLYDSRSGTVLAQKSEDIGRGHAERLLPLIDECFGIAGMSSADIEKIAVSVGPGSFTGIRVGVAAARGLALALDIPVVGVSTFSAIAHSFGRNVTDGNFAVLLKGGRGQIFAQSFDADGNEDRAPFIITEEAALRSEIAHVSKLIGNAAIEFDAVRGGYDFATGDIRSYTELGLVSQLPAKPVYLRSADAKLNEGFALPHAKITQS